MVTPAVTGYPTVILVIWFAVQNLPFLSTCIFSINYTIIIVYLLRYTGDSKYETLELHVSVSNMLNKY